MMQNKVLKNATWIIGCRIVQMLLSIVVTMLTARFLGPSGYGTINYAASLVAFVIPIMNLGLTGVLVYEIIHNPTQEGEIMGTSICMTLSSSVLCIIGVVLFTVFVNAGERETIIVCALYSIILIFQALEIMQYWFQAKLKSKYTSLAMLFAYMIVSIYKIVLLVLNCSIYLFAVSSAFDYMIIAVSLLIIYKKLGGQSLKFSWAKAKEMFARSKYYIVSNLMVIIFAETDKIMLKLMISSEATGLYSASVACAQVTNFVFSAIIDSSRPSILESEQQSDQVFETGVVKLYSVVIYLSLLQCIVITLFAPFVINILYGAEYANAVNPLRIIVWYTTFAYLGAVRNIWMLAKNKQKYLWILNVCGAAANIVLNLIFIRLWGMVGAALASLITQIFTNVVMNIIVWPISRNNYLMLKALNPKWIIHFAKGFISDFKRRKLNKVGVKAENNIKGE